MGTSEYNLSTQPGYLLVERPMGFKVFPCEQAATLMKISAACKEAGYRKVLILGPRTKVRLSVADIFELGREIARLELRIAIAEVHDASNEDVELLENVATSRGGPIQFFDNEQDAKDWLGV